MEKAKTASYQEVLEQFQNCGPLKAWSLIVTILGDLAAEEDARLPGPLITQLTEPMGLKPEALRVAIHRLRRDGWISSERDGRNSLYGLTAHGRALTRAVSHRIYSAEVAAPTSWHIVIAQTADAMQLLDLPELIPIGPKAALLPGEARGLPDTILAWEAQAGHVPDWVRAILVPQELVEAYARLAAALEASLALELPQAPLHKAVLRLLALHQWRRLVLRHGAGADTLMGPDWSGAVCRTRISALLNRIERPKPMDLATATIQAKQAIELR